MLILNNLYTLLAIGATLSQGALLPRQGKTICNEPTAPQTPVCCRKPSGGVYLDCKPGLTPPTCARPNRTRRSRPNQSQSQNQELTKTRATVSDNLSGQEFVDYCSKRDRTPSCCDKYSVCVPGVVRSLWCGLCAFCTDWLDSVRSARDIAWSLLCKSILSRERRGLVLVLGTTI